MKRIIVCISIFYIVYLAIFLHIDQGDKKQTSRIEKLAPSEEYFLMKQYPETTFHIRAYEKAIRNSFEFSKSNSKRSSGSWISQGPGNIGARANTIAVDPKNPNNMLIGFSDGGLFKTKDGGKVWYPVFDDHPRLSIGDIVYDPKNSDIAYAGTGDPNISGFPFIGDGIYKSRDGGETWQNIGLNETRVISQIKVSSQNSNIIYVSAMGLPFEKNFHRGVYKSNNGGDTWSQILFVNDSTGIADFVIHPTNHDIIFATGWNRIRNNKKSLVSGPDAKIYRSMDGGQNWVVLKNGLPEDNSSRIGIDISISNPNVLYASYTHPTTFNLKGIFKSVDGGQTWRSLQIGSSVGLAESIYGGFGWYFGKIRINPNNENDVFILGVDLWRSRNGGVSWERSAPSWSSYEVHADKHDLVFEGSNMYLTTDGGAYKSDINNVSWSDIENVPATQYYRVGYNPTEPDRYFGGAQDNGTSGGSALDIDKWKRMYGGDGFQPLFHPQNTNIFYVETQNGGFLSTINKGNSFQEATKGISANDPRNWDMPVIMSNHNPDILYTGTNRIYQNINGPAADWKAISQDLTDPSSDFLRHNISAIHESNVDPDVIAVGTSDGLVWITINKGDSWQNISPGLPRKYVSSIYFSPSSSNTLFVSFTGYKDNDNTPHIFKSNDFGKTWQNVQGNMPNVAINNIIVLPPYGTNPRSLLIIATDAGVFYTYSEGLEWKRMGSNMPFVTVYDIEYNLKNNALIAGTFGRSIMTFDLGQIGYKNDLSVIDNNIQKDLIVFPNIISIGDDFYISRQTTELAPMAYTIYNISGKAVKSGSCDKINKKISSSGLTKGLFFLVFNNGRTVISKTHKIIVL